MGRDAAAIGDLSDGKVRSRIRNFTYRIMRDSATGVDSVAGGFAVLNSEFPNSYEHNCLVVDRLVDPSVLMEEADRVLGGAGLRHRAIELDVEDVGADWLAPFRDCGYEVHPNLTMVLRRPSERASSTPVERVPYEQLKPMVEADWRRERPRATEQSIRQLVERRAATYRACEVSHHAVRGPDGIIARCDLYRIPPMAQVENVETEPQWQNRGYATAVVLDAVELAQRSGCDLIFLRADAEDWPQHLYRRLGFERAGGGFTLQRVSKASVDGAPSPSAPTH
jgi:GNAT superfamily N-acetyltransferase